MVALFALLVVDAAARYVMSRDQVAGWWISLVICPFWALTALLSGVPYAAYLALPWSIAALLNIRRGRRAGAAQVVPAADVDTVPSRTDLDND